VALENQPLVLAGNDRFFSAGADLNEISLLDAPTAYEFSQMGQTLMTAIESFPAPVYAAISGYCMGGGLDLALACHHRIASPHAVFGHRGAALGLMTGCGRHAAIASSDRQGPRARLVVAAEKVTASQALRIRLVDRIAADPVGEALHRIAQGPAGSRFR
jgi:enoyl-CoA hydratase/carnithine racemase